VFLAPSGNDLLPDEPVHVAIVLTGRVERRPVEADRPVDVYDGVDTVRAVAEALEIAHLGIEAVTVPGFHPSRAATVTASGTPVGIVGQVAPAVAEAFGLVEPVVAAELDLDALRAAPRRDRAFVAPSPFPPAVIDLAFVLATDVAASDVEATLRDSAGPLLEAVRVFDDFRSETLGADQRSLAFSLRFRAPDRTLTDDEVGERRAACVAAVEAAHGGQLRG
jgi:phenylalanyl-tRNA synthetase beta chain